MPTTFDWDSMQSFLAIARAGRLTVAAQRLGIDHTTLSRRIKELEGALQTRLFDRSVGGYVLTSQGERFLESAQAMETLALEVVRDGPVQARRSRARSGSARPMDLARASSPPSSGGCARPSPNCRLNW
jgi:DNA-binding transcriptional LysR family regulator